MLYIGIDVGVTGAVAALAADGSYVELKDLPLTHYGKFKWTDGMELLSILRQMRLGPAGLLPARAFVEFVAPMPKLGTVSSAAMGRTFGSVVATVQIAGLSLELVSPQKWKKALNCTSEKATTLGLARSRWPEAELHLEKHHNRAEALLIAEYGRRFNTGAI
jgi:hypothetical protein